MGKRSLVTIMRRKKMYRLYAEDIKNVHTFLIKKLPPLPTFDSEQTEDELILPAVDLRSVLETMITLLLFYEHSLMSKIGGGTLIGYDLLEI